MTATGAMKTIESPATSLLDDLSTVSAGLGRPAVLDDLMNFLAQNAPAAGFSPWRAALLDAVHALISQRRERFGKVFRSLLVTREFAICARPFYHRVPADFYLPDSRIAVACTAAETFRETLGRLSRLMASERVHGLILVTLVRSHDSLPRLVRDKPLCVVNWRASARSMGA